ncbi:CDP-alcohol phosphatidyltransferase [Leifsonia sp. F6_8S_P_1B]|uniref:CDP-alcohol phosphatidyltransferase n=1 Tax=Leifsonia williamsii TaxID=3035919 RepID=A0ABT8K8U4_9MICO|nr:CDP-alcohol phosphatidyltransferase [Leifsonia williamsii]MDN4613881.1 CDP-alcohol phosphatidyltransferase [Leifsonia williamsii]
MSASAAARLHPVRTTIATVLAVVALAAVALAPGLIGSGSALALLRLPLEAVLALAVLTLLPQGWLRRVVAVVAALLLVLTAVSAGLDRVFALTVGRPFDIVTGWPELVDGYGVVQDSAGPGGALALLVGVVVLALGAVIAVTASLLHLSRRLRPRRRAALIGASAVTAGWLVLALVGVQLVPGEPVAAADTVATAAARTRQVEAAAHDATALDRAVANDPFARVPASDLLTGLKGKDVVVAFVESYGRVAVQGSSFSDGVDAVLRQGEAGLAAHGYGERSAFLTSPTFGGVSWLAHSTLQSGLWVDSPLAYDRVTTSDRLTLAAAFRKAGWRTVSDVPSDTRHWPVGSSFYRFDEQLNGKNVGYRGPRFSYARVPDQYTLAYFQQRDLAKPHQPVMAEIDLVSSHTPWTPLPSLVPWDAIGDGSLYAGQYAKGDSPSVAWQDPEHVRQLYGQSIQYSLGALFSFLTTFDDPNLVLVVLGDHQPASIVSGTGAGHDVPVSIIAKDPAVLDRVASWRWEAGMLPSPSAPVWRMDAFRDRFLTAFGADGTHSATGSALR